MFIILDPSDSSSFTPLAHSLFIVGCHVYTAAVLFAVLPTPHVLAPVRPEKCTLTHTYTRVYTHIYKCVYGVTILIFVYRVFLVLIWMCVFMSVGVCMWVYAWDYTCINICIHHIYIYYVYILYIYVLYISWVLIGSVLKGRYCTPILHPIQPYTIRQPHPVKTMNKHEPTRIHTIYISRFMDTGIYICID